MSLSCDTLLLPVGLRLAERRWRVAHCLGHYFQHDGNQIWCHDNGIRFRPKQERQADVFAACVVTGIERDWNVDETRDIKAGRWHVQLDV